MNWVGKCSPTLPPLSLRSYIQSENIPWSSHVPDFTRVFSCTEQSVVNFLSQIVMQCLDSRATVAISADQITYLHFEILTCPKFFLC